MTGLSLRYEPSSNAEVLSAGVYSLQRARRLEAHVHAVRGVCVQLDSLLLLEALRRLHLAEHWPALRLLPHRQRHAKCPLVMHGEPTVADILQPCTQDANIGVHV